MRNEEGCSRRIEERRSSLRLKRTLQPCFESQLRSGIRTAALDEDAALGADTNAIDVGANELWRADRLIDRRTFVQVRVELLAFVEREIYLHGIRGRLVGGLR